MDALSNVQEAVYWVTTAPAPQLTPREWSDRADVAIVGGGYTGLCAARELAKRGARVCVLEARAFGWGASSRNGGMVLTGLKPGISALTKSVGLEKARALFCASLDAIRYVETLVQEEGIACDFRRCGHVELAAKPAHFVAYQREAEMLARDFQHPVRVVPADELQAEIGSRRYCGGLVDEASAGVNPAQYVSGLAQAADRAGAHLFAQTHVFSIARDGSSFVLRTSRGELRARDVLIATNGYTHNLHPYLRRRIVPIGSYIIATEPLPETLAAELSPTRRMMFDSKHFLYYFRLSADNRMIFGGRAGFLPETPHTVRESAAILRRGLLEVYPQLRDVRIAYAWGGTLAFAFDQLPHAGRAEDGVHYALGCGGHGVAILSYLGGLMGRRISGEHVESPFLTLPFPTAPLGLYDGKPWFLPLVGAYYRFLDLIR